MIGVDRLSGNRPLRLMTSGHACVLYARHSGAVVPLVAKGAVGSSTISDFISKGEAPRAMS
jgi:6-phosphogluconate dehydrogenase (decarboxylating)